MATTVSMPQLGETVTEGTILSWAKKPGDSIAADEILFEVSTDKVDTEVPSPVGGTVLEILVEEGDRVRSGQDLVHLATHGFNWLIAHQAGDRQGQLSQHGAVVGQA